MRSNNIYESLIGGFVMLISLVFIDILINPDVYLYLYRDFAFSESFIFSLPYLLLAILVMFIGTIWWPLYRWSKLHNRYFMVFLYLLVIGYIIIYVYLILYIIAINYVGFLE